VVWNAYQQLEQAKVKGAGPQKLLTNIISLIRFTLGQEDILEPFPETVESRFKQWLDRQRMQGKEFTQEQMQWLNMIKEHISASASIGLTDFEYAPFYEKGGAIRASKVFGQDFNKILEELNEVLVA
jgi:type I restriction enzyme R subunit